MGRRRKASNKSPAPKVRIGLPSIKKKKAPKPVFLPGQDAETTWDITKTQKQNFAALGLQSDTVQRGGRNKKEGRKGRDSLQIKSAEMSLENGELDVVLGNDEYNELQALRGDARASGKALPKRLTSHQRVVVAALVGVHGGDVEGMAKDRKLNQMQHSPGVLQMLLKSFHAYPCLEDGGYRGFHAPKIRS
mmetsp:Transcript_36823/g.51131  ORF Transcript_36823/g.51131 Transcript_36823/m.51131 type:complete len:191 (-) Transcript_36823:350-922(-)|eukprot:CAMPEP_0196575068 /NCGR_PEP_ID=MMETSP1081-20130531/4635_1 /TAXON_ID=36882 /ORGANISM="Pyramimonas amylifera, Strain CCMP720" /LENGTH=190 /DNA_ID=CAMNT_0041893259 /DNA_START=107 /DNA_END=679 /DNA_ORIENTATION=+